jgi:glycosyltransferase involved in cell wall biosynthesis
MNADSESALVSIIVPVFNAKYFIEEALNSILLQSYSNFEILVADDFSNDGTREVLLKFENEPRIKILLNTRNTGITENCNQLLGMCSGKYIATFAGDDVMLPGKLEQQVKFMENNPKCSFSYHAVEIFQSTTGQVLFTTDQSQSQQFITVHDVIRRMGIPGGMSVMFRKDCTPDGGFDHRLPFASDWLFQIDLAVSGKIGFIEGVYARYRKHSLYNGKDLSAYESEFIKVLDIVRFKYPQLAVTCMKGEARYYAGYAFRQKEIKDYRKNIRVAISKDNSILYWLALILSYIPFFSRWKNTIIRIYKKITL